MSGLKGFFQKKILDKKFSRLGPGHTLAEPDTPRPLTNRASDHTPRAVCSGPSEEASRAAEAALTRIAAKKAPAKRAISPLDAEKRALNAQLKEAEELAARFSSSQTIQEKSEILKRVLFCHPAILGDEFTGSYSEVDSAIEQHLLGETTNNPSEATTLLLIRAIEYSQVPTDAAAAAEEPEIDVRAKRRQNFMKILSNVISHPENDVYRRLRVSNRFVADLLAVKYAEDFFKVCGFVRTSLPLAQKPPNVETAPPETDEGSGPAEPVTEDFLILPASSMEDLTHLKSMLELLETAQPIVPLVFRDTTVMQAAGQRVRALTRDELPADFFTVSREDLRRLIEQQQKAQEESGMLLTKAMRERLKTRERRLYRFVLIRIRLPGELVLQGTFQASETLDDVRTWVAECLDNQAVVFKLWSPPGVPGLGRSPTARVALEDGFASLVDLGLAPCSLLTLSFEEDIAGGGGQSARTVNLRPDLLQKMQPLS